MSRLIRQRERGRTIDQSVTINGAQFGYSQTAVRDQIRDTSPRHECR
ncbi:hypothetical protein [Mycolicibacterium doricum]|nr:hypothetical protein [Mycolicibacterium doricum]MCV7269087.1 hypothetical protein [Mycolicibacterium doricum]